MDYLAREGAPISAKLWNEIDATVIETARKHMVCRRFISLYGPLGAGISSVSVDSYEKDEILEDGFAHISGRRLVELPQLYQDFGLLWRDLEGASSMGRPADLSAAASAAQRSAKQEDMLILYGNAELGVEGLFNASGAQKFIRSDWSTGEDAFRDIAKAIAYFSSNSMLGRYALALSPELFLDLQRLQPNVGVLEIDRIRSLLDGHVYPVGSYGAGKAALICAEPQYIDLAVGLDLSVAYLEQKDLNHYFRISETAALRIKRPEAIVHFE